MASYINLTLDTTGVTPLMMQINDGAERAASTAAKVTITLAEEDKANADSYSMMFIGDVVGAGEWMKFAYEKSIVLTDGDGLKDVTVVIRDDVYNEGDPVNDTITLFTSVPVATVSGPSVARLSDKEGKNISTFTFTSDKPINAFRVVLAENINVLHDDATNKMIPTVNGSSVTVMNDYGNSISINAADDLTFNMGGLGKYAAGKEFTVTIYGNDICEISPEEGAKIIKVFVREFDGNWSV